MITRAIWTALTLGEPLESRWDNAQSFYISNERVAFVQRSEPYPNGLLKGMYSHTVSMCYPGLVSSYDVFVVTWDHYELTRRVREYLLTGITAVLRLYG